MMLQNLDLCKASSHADDYRVDRTLLRALLLIKYLKSVTESDTVVQRGNEGLDRDGLSEGDGMSSFFSSFLVIMND